ncbi:MAG TPA: lysine-sensitive aspartokinase 3 [Bryobacterales bacterium]|nr:lysine-sensitive aspartokinase 3 [Bryobacterales bacterium]
MIVMKFGGSSIESAEAIQRVAGIVAARAERRPLVVVSALGKTTDRLLDIGRTAIGGNLDAALSKLDDLRQFHTIEAGAVVAPQSEPAIEAHLESHFRELAELIRGLAILGEMSARSLDALSSYGERLSSYIMTEALRARGMDAEHVDSRRVIVTDDRFSAATPLREETDKRLAEHVQPLIDAGKIPVMGGFIASTMAGITSTLGRGGSDYTASLVGSGLSAEEIQIWTDVDGVLTADPSLLASARRIRVLSFAEASELAYFGARVLHPSTMLPAVRDNIPIRVLNSRRPDNEGTLIVAEHQAGQSIVKSVVYKENITVVEVLSTRMLMAHGFLAKIFEVFDRHHTSVDMVTTSEVSVSLTIDNTARLDAIVTELRQIAEVTPFSGQSMVCVVGDNIRYTPGIAAKLFTALEQINIRMISQGASRLNISLVVDEKELHATVEALHKTFFSQVDEAVFA